MAKHRSVPPPIPRASASAPPSAQAQAAAPAQVTAPIRPSAPASVLAARPDRTAALSEGLRQAFRRHAAGVAVVTFTRRDEPVGFTATSVTSLSHRPPLVSLALATTSSLIPALLAARTLVVHLLGHDTRELAMRFAEPGADRFAPPTRWRRLETGEPLLSDAAVWLRCRIRERISAGDHWLVIAEVLDSQLERPVAPLVYHDGGYGMFHTAEPGRATESTLGAARAPSTRASAPRSTSEPAVQAAPSTPAGPAAVGTSSEARPSKQVGPSEQGGRAKPGGPSKPGGPPGRNSWPDGDLGIRSV